MIRTTLPLPQGSGVSMHYHRSAWNALLFGLKLWVLTPPADSKFRRDELAADSFSSTGQGWLAEAARRASTPSRERETSAGSPRRFFCVQRDDDVLFVPQGCVGPECAVLRTELARYGVCWSPIVVQIAQSGHQC